MNDPVVECPHCHQKIELTQALLHQIQDQALAAERQQHEKDLADLKKSIKQEQEKEQQFLQAELAQKTKALEEAQQAELALRKAKNQLEEEKRSFELEKQRQLDAERDIIRKKTQEELLEHQRLKDKEYELKIEGLKKSLDEAQRKANQGSQQLQGEVQEIDLEELLRRAFPGDTIEPIGKGVLGADIRQVVKSPKGTICGTILWESKRTKAWSDGWIGKLKQDMLADRANIPAIVTEVLPEEATKGIGLKDGVWVCSHALTIPLAMLLRKSLLDTARQKVIAADRQSKAETLYMYITSHDFAHQVEAMITIYQDMQTQIAKERVAFERSWKLREMQVNRLLSGVAGLYGSMQGIAGSAMPQIKGMDLTEEDMTEQGKLLT